MSGGAITARSVVEHALSSSRAAATIIRQAPPNQIRFLILSEPIRAVRSGQARPAFDSIVMEWSWQRKVQASAAAFHAGAGCQFSIYFQAEFCGPIHLRADKLNFNCPRMAWLSKQPGPPYQGPGLSKFSGVVASHRL